MPYVGASLSGPLPLRTGDISPSSQSCSTAKALQSRLHSFVPMVNWPVRCQLGKLSTVLRIFAKDFGLLHDVSLAKQ